MQTLVWMGGHAFWAPDVIAEQLSDFDDQRIHRHLEEAAAAGLIARDEHGYRLTDAGWALAADDS
jgi:hypothetical protein